MQVILLEKIHGLGGLGDTVKVKTGYGRNYLLPNKKALRANKENIAYFERERAKIEAANDARKKDAEKVAKALNGKNFTLIRQAGDKGQLFGSIRVKDIAAAAAEQKIEVQPSTVQIGQPIKTIGLFDIKVQLHADVAAEIRINIARSEAEAEQQAAQPEKFLGGISLDLVEAEKPAKEEKAAANDAEAEAQAAPAEEKKAAKKSKAEKAEDTSAETSEDKDA